MVITRNKKNMHKLPSRGEPCRSTYLGLGLKLCMGMTLSSHITFLSTEQTVLFPDKERKNRMPIRFYIYFSDVYVDMQLS